MAKTKEVSVFVTCDTEEQFESVLDAIMDVVGPASGAISTTAWEVTPDDPPGDGLPPSAF